MRFKYQLLILGDHVTNFPKLESVLLSQINDLGIGRDNIVFLTENQADQLDSRAPQIAVFFGYKNASDASHACLDKLLQDSVPILTCVNDLRRVNTNIPASLIHINAFALSSAMRNWQRLATLVLENFRLLRAERRLFISYKRSESEAIAIQLHEALNKAGFDVFLDTRSVPYGADFQSVLWHRMADSDVVVLLDTPNFRTSDWTQKELAQANATSIQILHLLWPTVSADKTAAFSKFHPLLASNFESSVQIGHTARLTDKSLLSTVGEVESLRARAIAARHRNLVDNFCDQARDNGVKFVTVQPQRFISVELSAGKKVAVVPIIGVPRADLYQEIDTAVREVGHTTNEVWVLFDERGLMDKWLNHLDWLNSYLPIAAVQVSKCAERLK